MVVLGSTSHFGKQMLLPFLFSSSSGQRGTIAVKLDFMYEEHLYILLLTGSERVAQTHLLASYFLVLSSIALSSSTFR